MNTIIVDNFIGGSGPDRLSVGNC